MKCQQAHNRVSFNKVSHDSDLWLIESCESYARTRCRVSVVSTAVSTAAGTWNPAWRDESPGSYKLQVLTNYHRSIYLDFMIIMTISLFISSPSPTLRSWRYIHSARKSASWPMSSHDFHDLWLERVLDSLFPWNRAGASAPPVVSRAMNGTRYETSVS